MKIGAADVHPLRIVLAVANLAVGLFCIGICTYGLFVIFGDLSHFTFTRGVVVVFCIYLGALSVATTISRVRIWRRLYFPGA